MSHVDPQVPGPPGHEMLRLISPGGGRRFLAAAPTPDMPQISLDANTPGALSDGVVDHVDFSSRFGLDAELAKLVGPPTELQELDVVVPSETVGLVLRLLLLDDFPKVLITYSSFIVLMLSGRLIAT